MLETETLVGRIDALDAGPLAPEAARAGALAADIRWFVRVVSSITPDPPRTLPTIRAEEADEIVRSSGLLERLRRATPELSIGPLARDRQEWIATGRPSHLPQREHVLGREKFVEVGDHEEVAVSTKPFGLGLHTSTALAVGDGMWWHYLDLHRESTLFPYPWTVFRLQAKASARVAEVASAAAWVDLLACYPRVADGMTYPDWRRIAADYDGVHLTIDSIAAIQGLRLRVADGWSAPAYWDVESTLWLHWGALDSGEPECIEGPTEVS